MKTVERIIDTLKTHRINDLSTRLDGNGKLIEQQYNEIDRLTWELVGTRIALLVACVGLAMVAYQLTHVPLVHVAGLECRL